MRIGVKTGVVAAGAAIAILGSSGAAQADPDFQPGSNDIVGVGSDTTMFAMNDVAGAYNATSPASLVASWDAFNPDTGDPGDTIWIKDANDDGVEDAAEQLVRPNGSSAGIGELRRDATCDDISDSLADFARSSRERRVSDSQCGGAFGGPQVLFLPFASDDLRYAVNADNGPIPGDGSDFPGDSAGTNAPLDLTQAELVSIYDCSATTWAEVRSGLPAEEINAMAPQEGSGTRQSFLDSLGLQDYGPCVNDTVQEHDAHPVDGDVNGIAPFSVGRFNTEVPEDANGVKPVRLNTSGFLFSRALYNVVIDQTPADGPSAGGVDPKLHAFFGDNDTNWGWICSDDATQVIEDAGFTQLDTIDDPDPQGDHFCGLSE